MNKAVTRIWLLMLIDAAEQAGLSPISKLRIHRLIFLATCLSPVYGVDTPPDKKILKYSRGPFYQNMQWDLDRLSYQRLLKISDIKHIESAQDGWWLAANYSLTRDGLKIIEEVTQSADVRQKHQFLKELVMSYAELEQKVLDDVALNDATYRSPGKAEWSLIDFSEYKENASYQAAKYFSHDEKLGIDRSVQEQVYNYLRYLEGYTAMQKEAV